MDAIKAIKTRRSIRSYKPDKISKKVLKDIIDCGRLAATAMNIQPWEFVVVTDSNILKTISANMEHSQFLGGSSAGIFVVTKNTEYYLEDGAAATENILIAANAYGISSCWIAGEKQTFAEKVLKLIAAPKSYKLVSIVSLGFANEKPKKQAKRRLGEVLHWEIF